MGNTPIGTTETSRDQDHPVARLILLVGILTVFVYVAVALNRYPDILIMYASESVVFLSALTFLMIGYTWVAVRRTRTRSEAEAYALRQGLWGGLVVGILWIIEIWMGNLANPQSEIAEFVVHLVYRLCIVAVPLVTLFTTFRATQRTGQISSGVWVGLWSGVLSALMVFGTFVVLTYVFPQASQTDPQTLYQFARSGFTDFAAFTLADALVAMISHLWIGPVLGLLFGALGSILGRGFMPGYHQRIVEPRG